MLFLGLWFLVIVIGKLIGLDNEKCFWIAVGLFVGIFILYISGLG